MSRRGESGNSGIIVRGSGTLSANAIAAGPGAKATVQGPAQVTHGTEIKDLLATLRLAECTAETTDPAVYRVVAAARERVEQELAQEHPRRSVLKTSMESAERVLRSVDRLAGLAEQVRSVAEKVIALIA